MSSCMQDTYGLLDVKHDQSKFAVSYYTYEFSPNNIIILDFVQVSLFSIIPLLIGVFAFFIFHCYYPCEFLPNNSSDYADLSVSWWLLYLANAFVYSLLKYISFSHY